MNAIGWLGACDALQPNENLEKLKYLETVISEKRYKRALPEHFELGVVSITLTAKSE